MNYMQVTFLAGGVVFALVAVVTYWLNRDVTPVQSVLRSVCRGLGAGAACGVVALCVAYVASIALTVPVPDESFIQGPDGEVRAAFGKHEHWYERYLWKWDDRMDGGRVISYAANQAVYAMETSPITENPRVLPVRLVVSVERFGTVEAYVAHHEAIGDTALSVWLESQMLDFYDVHSRDIAHWRNHYRQEQQEQCSELVRSFLEPRLARIGGRFKAAAFHVMTSGS